jgi:hypothetical protein
MALFAVLVALAPLQPFAQEPGDTDAAVAGMIAPEEVPSHITVTGQVLDAITGDPVAGASVSLLSRKTISDSRGEFTFNNVPSTRKANLYIRVIDSYGDIIGCSKLEVDVNVYPLAANSGDKMAIGNLETLSDIDVILDVVSLTGAALDEACSECHMPNPCLTTAEDASQWNTVTHLAGIAVTLEEFEEFKDKIKNEGLTSDMYTGLRYQDVHPQGVDVAAKAAEINTKEYQLLKEPKLLNLDRDGILRCDTCHTRHEPTGFSFFSRLDFEEDSTLCSECHL